MLGNTENELVGLECENCEEDLLKKITKDSSIVLRINDNNEVTDIYAYCNGHCNTELKGKYSGKDMAIRICRITNPESFLETVLLTTHKMVYEGLSFKESAYEEYKRILKEVYPSIKRELTEQERKSLMEDIE